MTWNTPFDPGYQQAGPGLVHAEAAAFISHLLQALVLEPVGGCSHTLAGPLAGTAFGLRHGLVRTWALYKLRFFLLAHPTR